MIGELYSRSFWLETHLQRSLLSPDTGIDKIDRPTMFISRPIIHLCHHRNKLYKAHHITCKDKPVTHCHNIRVLLRRTLLQTFIILFSLHLGCPTSKNASLNEKYWLMGTYLSSKRVIVSGFCSMNMEKSTLCMYMGMIQKL